MSTLMTLSELRTASRQRSDMQSSNFITDDELNSYINQSYFELYDILVQKYGDNYYVASPSPITTDGTNYLYDLPTDFYKLIGVDYYTGVNTNPWMTIKEFEFAERNRYTTPQASMRTQLWYIPKLTTLVDDADTCDGISGWTEYIIVDAAIKCLIKEESDVSVLLNDKQMLIQRIESAAENRNAGEPMRVTDVYERDLYYRGPTLRYRLNGSKIWLAQYQWWPTW